VMAENVKDATFSGFRILAAKDLPLATAILLDNSSVEVEDVEVEGAGIGVEIRGTASPSLRASSIHDCIAEGVLILGASHPWISHNDIRGNKGAGLAAHDGAKPALLQNVFDKNIIDPPELMAAAKEQNQMLNVPAAVHHAVPAAAAKKKEQ
jgi:hypothetical protein